MKITVFPVILWYTKQYDKIPVFTTLAGIFRINFKKGEFP